MQQAYSVGMDHAGRIKGVSSVGEIGAAVKSLRRAGGLTQAQLASRAGVSRLCISDLETTNRDTRTGNLLRVLAALDYEIDLRPARQGEDLTEYVMSFTDSAPT